MPTSSSDTEPCSVPTGGKDSTASLRDAFLTCSFRKSQRRGGTGGTQLGLNCHPVGQPAGVPQGQADHMGTFCQQERGESKHNSYLNPCRGHRERDFYSSSS